MDVSALLASFASAFDQDTRLFKLHFADGGLDGQLLPHTLSGDEAVSASYRFELTCLCSDTTIELKRLMGQPVDIVIGLADGGERVVSGVVTQAKQLGADGGFATYGLVVEPTFSVLKLRRNSRVFQDKSVVDIVRLILDEHLANNPAFAQSFRHREQLTASYSSRSYCQQYRESDLAFIERLLREEGISYYFDFAHGPDEIGVHTLVLFDAGTQLDAAPQSDIRFHRADATEDADSMTTWHATRQLQSASLDLSSFDYKGVYTQQGSDNTAIDHGDAGSALTKTLTDYEPQSLALVDKIQGGASNNSDLNRYAMLRQQAKDLRIKTFTGSGAVRGLGAGQWFTLNDHPIHDGGSETDRQFTVLRHQFHARNNLPGDLSDVVQSPPNNANVIPFAPLSNKATDESATPSGAGYWNQVEAVRKHIPIVPTYSETEHAKPTAPGSQTAIVVGPADEEIYTDESGRIKIQFHWAREQDHDVGQHGAGAAKDDHSSCWVRVMMPCTGNQWGHEFLPRIGQEAKIIFIEGDIDRPLCIGVIHNGQHNPPTFSGAGSLPANKTLSGIKSQEYKGSRYNELVFDDTTGEIRTKFSSEHGKTQLNQGYLIHPRSEGQGTPRGEGFELRTDNAGAIRAAQGLLVTTEPQQNASGQQLDKPASQAQLEAAQNLTTQLGDTADNQHANKPTPDKIDTDHLKNKEPYLQLHGQGGIALTTPQSIAIATGKDFNQIAQRDTHQTSGRRWIHNVGESISLFVTGASNKLNESIKLIAAKGTIQIQAQANDIEITADKKITVTACKEKLTASAKGMFLMTAGGGYIKMQGGNIEIGAPKKLSMKASSFEHVGAVSYSVTPPVMPNGTFTALSRNQVVVVAANAAPAVAAGVWQSFYKNELAQGQATPEPATVADKSEQRGLLNAQKAARWQERKTQIAQAKEKSATMPAGSERDELNAATERFEKNNVAVEKARLSADVYAPKDGPPPGWKNISNDPEQLDTIGLKEEHLQEPNSNFRAQVYVPDPEVFGDDMKTTVSFKGTDFNCKEDWANNVAQGVDKESLYYKKAVTLGRDIERQGAEVEITGHSLGGGLASAAARASGKPATTFNAAGLHKNTVARYGGTPITPDPDNILAYRVDGEVLTGTQEQKLGGTAITSGAGAVIGGLIGGPVGAAIGAGIGAVAKVGLAAGVPNAAGTSHSVSGSGLNPVDRHSMMQVIDGIEKQKQDDQAILSKQVGGSDGKG